LYFGKSKVKNVQLGKTGKKLRKNGNFDTKPDFDEIELAIVFSLTQKQKNVIDT